MFNFYVWMVLDYDTWYNKILSCGILIEFVQNKFKSIFRYVHQTNYLHTYLFRLTTYLGKTYLPT
jgi:hypothetical protein